MRPQLRKLLCVPLLMAVSGLVHCGGQASKSSEVEISLSPENPVVITSDLNLSIGGSEQKIKGPWFKFAVRINNQAEDPVTIVALHVEVTGVDESGIMTTVKKDFDPGFLNYTTTTFVCQYSDFGEFDRRGDKAGTGGYYNKMPLYVINSSTMCSGGGGTPYGVYFYFDNGPKPPFATSNYRYLVKIQPLGWFGTRLEPKDRFDGFAIGNTQ